jgi:hypothetical protein
MTRYQIARALAGVTAFGFFFQTGLHVSQYNQVVLQAQRGYGGEGPLVAALWLSFGAAMLVLGGMVTLVALAKVRAGRWLLALAGCFPLITVLLQLQLLGFTRSTAILAGIATVSLGAAILFPNQPQPVDGSAG